MAFDLLSGRPFIKTKCLNTGEGAGGGGVLNKVLYSVGHPRGPNLYPFIYHSIKHKGAH